MKFQACKCERVMLLDRRGCCIGGFATNPHRGLSVLGLKIDGKAIRFRNPFVSHATFAYCLDYFQKYDVYILCLPRMFSLKKCSFFL